MSENIRLGISTCLLGEKVRYDGGHKLNRYLKDTLGRFVEYVPVCPEVECGLSTPREPMHLSGDPDNPRLVTIKSGTDHTERMINWGRKKLEEFKTSGLCGFIFKSRSPSSGMERIKIYKDKSVISYKGIGIWAGLFMDFFPYLPVEDDGRLNDPVLRENFIERIFVYSRWREIEKDKKKLSDIVDFHTRHKLIFMMHHPHKAKELGKIVAAGKDIPIIDLFQKYMKLFTDILKYKATVKKNVNILFHSMGYFKRTLSSDEKQELLEIIDEYRNENVPLIVPLTLINHYIRKYDEPYLKKQYYFNPHPIELKLRNHV